MIAGRRVTVLGAVLAAGLLGGCSAAPAAPSATVLAGSPVPVATEESPGATAATLAPGGPAWLAEPLIDVRTGAPVRLGDLVGHVVFVEGMATWCPPCLEQQHEAEIALSQLPSGMVIYVSVDIDPREAASTLSAYVDRNQFGWQFLLATPAFLRELSDTFGATILSPPATPVVVIDMSGHGTLTEIGIKRASRLIELAHALGA